MIQRHRWWLMTTVLAALAVTAGAEDAAPAGRLQMLTFDDAFDMNLVKSNGGQGERGGTPEAPALRVITETGSWPGVIVNAPGGKWDLSAYQYISIDIHNIDTHDIDVFVRVDNPGANGQSNCITERIGTQPDQRVTLAIPLPRKSDSAIKLFGMNGYPQGLFAGGKGLDVANIVAITVFTTKPPPGGHHFEIRNVYAAGKYETPSWATMTEKEFFPFVDTFGQFKHKDWPGKIRSEDELQQRRDEESRQFAQDPGPATWNKWGGWANGPQLEATGHFRTAKHEGKWWLVDPDGRLFFMTGLTCVGFGGADTPIEDRDGWFEDLPPEDETHRAFFGKHWKVGNGHYAGREPKTFNFSTYNLSRKYGADWKKVYPEVIHQRLRRWGINTIGNWSDGRIARMQKTPYTMTFFYNCRNLRDGKVKFPDVFDPQFAPSVMASAEQWLKGTVDDPYCIGYFLDNEMSWGGETYLARNALDSKADQPAKLELVRWLQERYPNLAAFNAAWGKNYGHWDALVKDTKVDPKTDAATKDLTDFTGHIAETYFRTVRQAIKRIAPNKLYLGCRCVGGAMNMVTNAAKYCDVISYNRYCYSVRDMLLPGGIDAPTMIGEFHFGALDRGQFWGGLCSADSQEARGAAYRKYVQSALENPQIVGVHWFQYGDQAVTGRGDGENAQCGFIDVCDTPYKETIDAARGVAETMYDHRLNPPTQ